ncbi:1-family small gtpase [Plasmopara halstedii]|uniref:1-family small gtpase n=1 Tax=Plasmopara halstedii TaxID=4781 RepID=A0A0P1AAI3_PLAHL|nr:1-family small gtpase [Plasmopara halstedii]CEG37375.1 1-family small gtpase [Plasmopara halstedii]|eukprot:XP_024573744.1 1-family small gtpase [Plasmopara halstedii]
MFSLFWGLWNYLFSKAELHLLIVGLDDAGKTTLLEQLKGIFGKKPGIPLEKIPPTVGLNIARVNIKRSRVIFWDLGGQERLRAIWNKYYSESHGVVFVIDSANERRFQEAKVTLHAMLANPELSGIPLVVLANKMDLENAQPVKNIVKWLEVEGHQGAVASYPICALTREGIEGAIDWLVDAVMASERYYEKMAVGSA